MTKKKAAAKVEKPGWKIGDERLLKAANLFTHKDAREMWSWSRHPWLQRIRGKNIIVATNGHYMFVAEDKRGTRYPKHPTHTTPTTCRTFPKWSAVISLATPRRSEHPVWVNPRYLERVAKAGRLLGEEMISISSESPSACILFQISPCAFVGLMPMRHEEGPAVPTWLRDAIKPVVPLAKKTRKKPTKRK